MLPSDKHVNMSLVPLTLGAHVKIATYDIWCLKTHKWKQTKPTKQKKNKTNKKTLQQLSPQAKKGGLK